MITFDVIEADTTSYSNWLLILITCMLLTIVIFVPKQVHSTKISINLIVPVFLIHCHQACCHRLCCLTTLLSVSERPGSTSQRASNQQSGAERDDGILLQETGRIESKLQ